MWLLPHISLTLPTRHRDAVTHIKLWKYGDSWILMHISLSVLEGLNLLILLVVFSLGKEERARAEFLSIGHHSIHTTLS